MVNLIAGEEVVPELVQQNFTAANVVAQIGEILPDGMPRDRMLAGLECVRSKLRAPGATPPAERAAKLILNLDQLKAKR